MDVILCIRNNKLLLDRLKDPYDKPIVTPHSHKCWLPALMSEIASLYQAGALTVTLYQEI